MNNSTVKQAVLYASDARGIYIPQHFAESYNVEQWETIDQESLDVLLLGPEQESYWDVWCDVLDNAETVCGGTLHQDGDLWIIWTQLAIDAVNELCESQLDYEESHDDAGDCYSHMVAESWDSQKDSDLLRDLTGPEVYQNVDYDVNGVWQPQWSTKWSIDPMGLESDVLSDLAIDLFVMQRGSIHGCYTDGIVLGAYAIQEIEIDLDRLGIDAITMDLIRESCDAYITGTDRAYMTTDAVWFAVVDPDAMQQAIIDYVNDHKEEI